MATLSRGIRLKNWLTESLHPACVCACSASSAATACNNNTDTYIWSKAKLKVTFSAAFLYKLNFYTHALTYPHKHKLLSGLPPHIYTYIPTNHPEDTKHVSSVKTTRHKRTQCSENNQSKVTTLLCHNSQKMNN